MSSPDTANLSIDQLIELEFFKFKNLQGTLVPIYNATYKVLMVLGLVGGVIGIGTMLYSRHMKVTSFLYHKLIMLANLVFCVNWVALHLVDTYLAIIPNQYQFRSYLPAFYSGPLQRFFSSSTGYMWQYMSLLISLDRCIALGAPEKYKTFSSSWCCWLLVTISVLLSLSLHSWATLLERAVVQVPLGNGTYDYTWNEMNDRIPEHLLFAKVSKSL